MEIRELILDVYNWGMEIQNQLLISTINLWSSIIIFDLFSIIDLWI